MCNCINYMEEEILYLYMDTSKCPRCGERFAREIKYEIDNDHKCLTKCPYNKHMGTKLIYVGSTACGYCKCNKLDNSKYRFVMCSNTQKEE